MTNPSLTPPLASNPDVPRSRLPVRLIAILLALATIAIFWPATRQDFVNYDDPEYVTENAHVQGGLNWEGVKWAFLHPVASDWHPLTLWSHMADCQLFGLKPWGHHLVNGLLHAANTALVFLLFRRLTGATWRSLVLAALFGWHPLRVESVAWVAERKDVLSGFFFLLTLLMYAQYVERSNIPSAKPKISYGVALLFFALGLMSKPMLVTVPCVLLLLDYWPLGRFKPSALNPQPSTFRRLVTEKIPFFALAAVASVVTFAAQKQGGSVEAIETLPPGARIGNALVSYCRYLGKLFWPTDLAVFYPHPGYWPMTPVLLAGVMLTGISALLFVTRRRYPFLLMGWLWFCGTLVPVIGLVQVGDQAMADRYTYIPSLGVLLMVIWGVCELTVHGRCQMIVLSATGAAALVLCITLTQQQLGYWQDSETLFRHALEITENNYIAHNNLGAALNQNGRVADAILQFQEAIRIKPADANAQFNLGTALLKQNRIEEAIHQFQAAIRLKPDYAEAHYNLGTFFLKHGQTDGAIREFQAVVRLRPDDAKAHNNLGIALSMKGQLAEAIGQFQDAIRLRADYTEAQNNLARALGMKNRPVGH